MSYTIKLSPPPPCPTCGAGPVEESWDPTFNLAAIFEATLPPAGIRSLNGRRAGDVLELLRAGAAAMQRDGEALRRLEPTNGWGTLDDAVKVVGWLIEAAERNPEGVFSVR